MSKYCKPRVELNDDGSVYIRTGIPRHGKLTSVIELFVEPQNIANLISDLAHAQADHASQLYELISDDLVDNDK